MQSTPSDNRPDELSESIEQQRVPASEITKLYQEFQRSEQEPGDLAQSIKLRAITDDRYGGKL